MRKPLLEFLMSAAEQGGHPAVDRIFREIGEFMAVAWLESKWLLDPAVDPRILFGRLVKRRACFDLMVEGARAIAPALVLEVADDEMANTDLMRQLRDSERLHGRPVRPGDRRRPLRELPAQPLRGADRGRVTPAVAGGES